MCTRVRIYVSTTMNFMYRVCVQRWLGLGLGYTLHSAYKSKSNTLRLLKPWGWHKLVVLVHSTGPGVPAPGTLSLSLALSLALSLSSTPTPTAAGHGFLEMHKVREKVAPTTRIVVSGVDHTTMPRNEQSCIRPSLSFSSSRRVVPDRAGMQVATMAHSLAAAWACPSNHSPNLWRKPAHVPTPLHTSDRVTCTLVRVKHPVPHTPGTANANVHGGSAMVPREALLSRMLRSKMGNTPENAACTNFRVGSWGMAQLAHGASSGMAQDTSDVIVNVTGCNDGDKEMRWGWGWGWQ